MLVDLVGHDLPTAYLNDTVGHGGQGRVMGDHDDGASGLAAGLLQKPQHLFAGLVVQGTGGLVAQQELGVFGQGPGNGHPLLLAAGQRFGVLDIDENNTIRAFREKQDSDGSRINAGYMVLEPKIFDFIEGDSTVFEKAPLEKCAELGELKAYNYNGFWQCMDTKREMEKLEELWQSGKAPWKSWE